MTERDKIKQRIAKLLNLTTDNGASEAEAMQAAELMAHYDLFDLISNAILAEIDGYRSSSEYRSSSKNGRALINSFINGMEDRIGERIEELGKTKQRTVQEATGRALVLVKEAQIEEDFVATGIWLVRGGGSYRWGVEREGYASGAAAGGHVSLSAGVRATRPVGALR